jgi:hypothetical protein
LAGEHGWIEEVRRRLPDDLKQASAGRVKNVGFGFLKRRLF